MKIAFKKNIRQFEVMEYLPLFGAESCFFQFAIEKYEDYDVHNYKFACCFVWV